MCVFVCSPAVSLEQLARVLEDLKKEPVMQDLERKRQSCKTSNTSAEVLPFDKLILVRAQACLLGRPAPPLDV
jgi:hypothetical protein